MIVFAALIMLLPVSGEAQSITRNKKQQTTTKSKHTSSSSSGKSKKTNNTTTQKSSNCSNGMTQAQKNRIIQKAINDMVYVEGGTFMMGATEDQHDEDYSPRHQVTLRSYYISKFEVTQGLWQAVMGQNPSHYTGNSRRPVECVSWSDCQKFITKLNQVTGKQFRLPTEAEWEFAALGGKHSKGYKYSGSYIISDVAWYSDNSGGTTHPVGQKSPNELGLYDMSGNVREWCQDWLTRYSSTSQTNPTGPSTGSYRVMRGGAYYSVDIDLRFTERSAGPLTQAEDHIGLRLAASSI